MTRFTVEGTGEPLYKYAIWDAELTRFVWPRYRDEELQLALDRCKILNDADDNDKAAETLIVKELTDAGFERNGDRWQISGTWGSATNLTQHEAYMALLRWQGKEEA